MKQMTFDDMDEPPFEISNFGSSTNKQGVTGSSHLSESNPLFELVDDHGSATPMYSFSG